MDQLCADDFYNKEFKIGSFIEQNCVNKCPLQCKAHIFDYYPSLFKYPEPAYVQTTLKTNTMLRSHYSNHTDFTENLALNVVKLSIFYDSLFYYEVKENPRVRWDMLLGTIGGHLHLFLGMSLMSFAEIFELLMLMLHDKCKQVIIFFQIVLLIISIHAH